LDAEAARVVCGLNATVPMPDAFITFLIHRLMVPLLAGLCGLAYVKISVASLPLKLFDLAIYSLHAEEKQSCLSSVYDSNLTIRPFTPGLDCLKCFFLM
jgi:hypothetical protein